MNIAIVTARGGKQSIPGKNLIPIAGRPLVSYPLQVAGESSVIRVFLSTDCQKIALEAERQGAAVIWRPPHLQGDDVDHGDVIEHAVSSAKRRCDGDVENVVVLLGNTVMVDSETIDESLRLLDEYPLATGVISVWEAADDHPYRALALDEGGYLKPFGEGREGMTSSRQAYPPVTYYDQGVWTFRQEWVYRREGPSPWWWVGPRCLPLVRPWVTGRDIHGPLDIAWAEWWVRGRPYPVRSGGGDRVPGKEREDENPEGA